MTCSPIKLEQYVSDKVASAFVHELVNMKACREYLSPSRATTRHCILPARIEGHQQSCWNQEDVQFSRTVPCSRCRHFLCGLTASGYEVTFSKTLGRYFRDEDNKPKTKTAYDQLELLIPNSRERVAVVRVVRPKLKLSVNRVPKKPQDQTYFFSFLHREHVFRLTCLIISHSRTLSVFVFIHFLWTSTVVISCWTCLRNSNSTLRNKCYLFSSQTQ